jgi:hypothetical protein
MKQVKHLRQQKAIGIVATLALTRALAGIAIPAQAQTFTSLHSFGGIYGPPRTAAIPPGWCRAPTDTCMRPRPSAGVKVRRLATARCSKSAPRGRKRSSITFTPRA